MADWKTVNGFEADVNSVNYNKTFIYFPRDSYEVKEELKAAGFKFNQHLLWHCPSIPEGYEDKVVEVNLHDVAEIAAWGEGFYRPDVKTIVKNLLAGARPKVESKSQYVGEKGERIRNIRIVESSFLGQRDGMYGMTNNYLFVDECGNRYYWSTTSNCDVIGYECLMTATVKNHFEYREEPTTGISRAKFEIC